MYLRCLLERKFTQARLIRVSGIWNELFGKAVDESAQYSQ